MSARAAETELVAGFPTHVERLGRGVRRALFIHCTLGHAGSWHAVQAVLLGRLAMTAFDRPGHGRSGEWSGQGGSAGLHALTTAIAAGLIERQADVVGHSYGATLALRLALESPERARRLVLIEPPLFAAVRGTPEFAAHDEAMARFVHALEADDRLTAAREFHTVMTPQTPWERLSERARGELASQIHLIAQEVGVTMDDSAGLLAEGRLEALTQPVLLLEGTASPPIMRAVHEALAARLPQAQRVLLAGAGHMAPLTHPENVAGEIAAFFKV